MKLLLIVLLFTTSVFAQFTKNDYNLVKTTFNRDFDKSIITPYLLSDDANKVTAALYSISNSGDTSFIPEITNLDFKKYCQKIAYALGQLPRTEASINYLFSNLSVKNNYVTNKQIYTAIGKIGNKDDLEKLITDNSLPQDGKFISFAHFSMRRIRSEKIDLSKIVSDELFSDSKEETEDNLWALLRIGGDSTKVSKYQKIVFDKGNYNTQSRIYALQILNRVGITPFNFDELSDILNDEDWRIRNEVSKIIKNASLSDENFIKLFDICVNDKNPNVSRTFA